MSLLTCVIHTLWHGSAITKHMCVSIPQNSACQVSHICRDVWLQPLHRMKWGGGTTQTISPARRKMGPASHINNASDCFHNSRPICLDWHHQFSDINNSQGIVATRLRCGVIFMIITLLQMCWLLETKFRKSITIWRRLRHEYDVFHFFETQCMSRKLHRNDSLRCNQGGDASYYGSLASPGPSGNVSHTDSSVVVMVTWWCEYRGIDFQLTYRIGA